MIAIRPTIFCFLGRDSTELYEHLPRELRATLGEVPEFLGFVTAVGERVLFRVGRGAEECGGTGPGDGRLVRVLEDLCRRVGASPSGAAEPRGSTPGGEDEPSSRYRLARRTPQVFFVQSVNDPRDASTLFASAERLHDANGDGALVSLGGLLWFPASSLSEGAEARTKARRLLRWVEIALDRGILFPALLWRADDEESLRRRLTSLLALLCDTELADRLWDALGGATPGRAESVAPPVAPPGAPPGDRTRRPMLAAVSLASYSLDEGSVRCSLEGELVRRLATRLEPRASRPGGRDGVDEAEFDRQLRGQLEELLARSVAPGEVVVEARPELVGCLRRLAGRQEDIRAGDWHFILEGMDGALRRLEEEAERRVAESRPSRSRPPAGPPPAVWRFSDGRWALLAVAIVLSFLGVALLLVGSLAHAFPVLAAAMAAGFFAAMGMLVGASGPPPPPPAGRALPARDPMSRPARQRRDALARLRREVEALERDWRELAGWLRERSRAPEGPTASRFSAREASRLFSRVAGEGAVERFEDFVVQELSSAAGSPGASLEREIASWSSRAIRDAGSDAVAEILRQRSEAIRDAMRRGAKISWPGNGGREVAEFRFAGSYRALAREGDLCRDGPDDAVCVRLLSGVSSRDFSRYPGFFGGAS
ncbi:MAG: hypothetical protein O7J95_06600 [Planctomycetota bacterium]|nr:hypothetical protein [Planctomycetota bacterium]